MSSKIKTYNPKEVIVTCGTHIVTGYADDSFISIEPNGDGITKKTGCDGEIPVQFRRTTPTRSSSPCCRPATATRTSPAWSISTATPATVCSRF